MNSPSTAPSILLIERDPPTLELYRRELSRDYFVLACAEPEPVPALLCGHAVVAVVLDPGLPDEGGWSLISSLRNGPSGLALPIILCSALDEQRRGLALGATTYLVKPVLPATLRDTLRRLLAPSRPTESALPPIGGLCARPDSDRH